MKDHKLTFFFVKISVWKITIYNCSEHNANDQMKKKTSSNQEMRFGVFDHALEALEKCTELHDERELYFG